MLNLPYDRFMPIRLTNYLEPDYEPHFKAWQKKPSPETSGNLLKAVDPIVHEAMRTYGGASSTSPTLYGKAKRLTLDAIQSYDPSRAKLRTHLLTQLQGLRRMSAKEEQIVHVPEQLGLDRRHMQNAEMELRDKLSRDPSDMELADHTGLSRKRIASIRGMTPALAEGLMTRESEQGAGVWQPVIVNRRNKGMQQAWEEFVYGDLDPIDQLILEHSVGLHNKDVLSNQDIARKLKLSPGAISQRKARIQDQLNTFESTGMGGE